MSRVINLLTFGVAGALIAVVAVTQILTIRRNLEQLEQKRHNYPDWTTDFVDAFLAVFGLRKAALDSGVIVVAMQVLWLLVALCGIALVLAALLYG